MTKSTIIMTLICTLGLASCHAQHHQPALPTTEGEAATVYMTTDISPEGLVRIYEALGVEAHGRVAVKISTGESEQSNHLRPELIKNLVQKVNGTHTVEYAEQLGLGTRKYTIVNIDNER